MITLRKLATLDPRARRRKIVRIIEGWERSDALPASGYIRGVTVFVLSDPELTESIREVAANADGLLSRLQLDVTTPPPSGGATRELRRALNTLRHVLAGFEGIAPGDWDLVAPAGFGSAKGGRPDDSPLALGRVALYLESIRSPFNLGSMARSAAAFGVRYVGVSDDCPPLDHPRVVRSAMGALGLLTIERGPIERIVELLRESDAGVRDEPSVVALEIGGEPISSATLPSCAVIVLGSEELGVSDGLLARAQQRVSIPMPGAKASLNVAVACGIALAAWQAAGAT